MYLRGLNGFGNFIVGYTDTGDAITSDGQPWDGSTPGVGDAGGADQGSGGATTEANFPLPGSTNPGGAPSDTGPGATAGWTGLIGQVLSTWGNIQQTKIATQGQVQVAQAQGRYLPVPARTVAPGYSPFLGQTSGAGTLLLLGGVGLAAYFLMK